MIGNLASDLGRPLGRGAPPAGGIGAGAGMAAVYSVPLGGALFALEVLRGALALRLVLPALAASTIATGDRRLSSMPNAPIYPTPAYAVTRRRPIPSRSSPRRSSACGRSASCGLIAWADRSRPSDWRRYVAPALVFVAVGLVSIPFPEVLGNGQDVAERLFRQPLALVPLLVLLPLRPLCTVASVASGAPGGLFTPSLSAGALAGGALGALWLCDHPARGRRPLRPPRRRRDDRGDDAGPDSALVMMMESDRRSAPLRPADADRHRRGDRDGAQLREALDLRGAAHRRGRRRATAGAAAAGALNRRLPGSFPKATHGRVSATSRRSAPPHAPKRTAGAAATGSLPSASALRAARSSASDTAKTAIPATPSPAPRTPVEAQP